MANEYYRTLQTILQSSVGLQISHKSLRVLLNPVRRAVAIEGLGICVVPEC